MAEISIILPTLRKDEALKRIKEFEMTNENIDYEIIVISPFYVEGKKIKQVLEKTPQGVIAAMNKGYEIASAHYVCWWSDAASPTQNCLLNMINFLKTKHSPFIGAFRIKNIHGRELSQWKAYERLYACWGCASKETINTVGGLFDPVFHSYFADPDLGLRVWEKGGVVAVCPDAYIIINRIPGDKFRKFHKEKYFQNDMQIFFNRWHPKLGKSIKQNFYQVIKPAFEYEEVISIFPFFLRPLILKLCDFYYTHSQLRESRFLRKIWEIIRDFYHVLKKYKN
jgi:GT2 family glycosyltransferase